MATVNICYFLKSSIIVHNFINFEAYFEEFAIVSKLFRNIKPIKTIRFMRISWQSTYFKYKESIELELAIQVIKLLQICKKIWNFSNMQNNFKQIYYFRYSAIWSLCK